MGTIIKDLVILNEDDFYLTKQDKTIKNEYNVIGKSYNKKEKYKTQNSNYEISLEYILNKIDKLYFFNLLNNNNYFLYKNNINFNCSFVNDNLINYMFININDAKELDVFNYDENNRLYVLINNNKYSFKFDESYDYQLNDKYRFIDEISSITTNNINTIAYVLDLCILVNNSIKFKLLTDEKYSLSFDIETINNIISSLSIQNTIDTNNIQISKYVENFGYKQNILYTKTVKLNEQHYLNICAYALSKFNEISSDASVYEDNFYITIKYQKVFINNNEINILDEFYSKINLYHDYKNYFIDISNNIKNSVYKEEFLKNVNFNVKLTNNNNFYLTYTIAEKERMEFNYKHFDEINKIFVTKQKVRYNLLLNTYVENFRYEITNDKMNIIKYKTYFKKELVKYNSFNKNNEWLLNFDPNNDNNTYFYNNAIRSCVYIYNNNFYITTILSNIIITNTINTKNDLIENVNKYDELNFRINKNIFSASNSTQLDSNYDSFFRTIIQEDNKDNYKIINITKNQIFSFNKNENELLHNFNLDVVENDKVKYFLTDIQYSKIGINDFATNLSFKSNDKEIFFKIYREDIYASNFIVLMSDFLKNNFIIKNNLNEYKNIININYINGFNDNDLKKYFLDYKNNINFYFNTNTNKYNLIYNSNDLNGLFKTTLIEFEYDNINTITISNVKTIDYFFNINNILYSINATFNTIIKDNDFIELHQTYFDLVLKKNYIKYTKLDYNYNIINEITKEIDTYY